MTPVAPVRLTRDPNVVPMIDVLLVLLIIFMITTVIERRTLDLQLPQPSVESSSAASIVLSVDPGPRYVLNGSPIEAPHLPAELQRVFRDRPEKVLFVKGAAAVRYQDVMRAFDIARGAGVRVTGVVLPR